MGDFHDVVDRNDTLHLAFGVDHGKLVADKAFRRQQHCFGHERPVERIVAQRHQLQRPHQDLSEVPHGRRGRWRHGRVQRVGAVRGSGVVIPADLPHG